MITRSSNMSFPPLTSTVGAAVGADGVTVARVVRRGALAAFFGSVLRTPVPSEAQ